jgi:hypothetical protein
MRGAGHGPFRWIPASFSKLAATSPRRRPPDGRYFGSDVARYDSDLEGAHTHLDGFEHLDLDVASLSHEFHLSWKLLPATDGPTGFPGEPYIPLAVSFAMRGLGRRQDGHLDYALSRSFWQEQQPPTATDEDGEILAQLVRERLPADLRELDAGRNPEALRLNRTPKSLRP